MFFGLSDKEKRTALVFIFIFIYLTISIILFAPIAYKNGFNIILFLKSVPKLFIVKAPLSAVLVFALSIIPNYDLSNIKSREVGDGQHGNARFANENEIKEQFDIVPFGKERKSGLIVGVEHRKKNWIVDTSDNNMLLLAPPGAGKTKRAIIPSIIYNAVVNMRTANLGASMLITDLKGEELETTAMTLQECGYVTPYLNLRDPFKSYRFNLLNNVNVSMDKYLSSDDEREKLAHYGRAERYAKVLAESIVNNIDTDSKSDAGTYFNETAQGLLTGIILIVSEYGEENQRHIISVFNLIIELNGMDDTEVNQKNKLASLLENIKNDRIKSYVGPAMSADFKTSMNIFSSALGKLVGLIDAELEQMITQHSKEINDIDFVQNPTAIFIICPDENPTRYFFASLFIRYFCNDLLEQARHNKKGKLDRNVIIFADEFGNLPPIKNIDTIFSAIRSAGIRIVPTIQSLAQLEKSYNRNTAKIIRSTCQITMTTYVAPMDNETAEEISKILGNRTIQSGSVSSGKGGSQTIQMMAKPLMSTNEIINLTQGEFIIIKSGSLPSQTKLPLYWDYLPDPKEFTYMASNEIVPISRMSEDDLKFIGSGGEKLKVGMFG